MNFSKTFLAGLLAFIVGNILIAVLWSLFVMGIVGALSATTGIDDNSILRIDLSENIVEAPPADPFAGVDFRTMTATPHVTLFEALRAIDAAKSDPRIKGIYIRPNGQGTVSMAVLEELRAAILDFKQESGKFVLAYNEAYGQGGYYLATAADGVYLQPEGLLDWHGMAVNTLFFKGLLDKLDLKVEVFRPTACKYKSAVEPYILTKLSDANREQLGQLVHSMWSVIAGDVAESRGLTIEMLDEYADELSAIQPEDALAKGMVDGLKYEDEMNDLFAEAGVEADGDGQYRFVSLGRYAAQVGPDMRHMGADRVAVLYADGQIVDGEGYDAVYGNTLAEKIRQLRLDDGVKAVVVRVNSPGGSALASDVIWREMELLKAEKPVIVSMGAYAASGGYYISAPADAIVADRLTLTGSIGVFGMLLDAGDAMERKLGVTVDAVKSNRSADLSIFRGLTPTERAMMLKSGLRDLYEPGRRRTQSARRESARYCRRARMERRRCARNRVDRLLRRLEERHCRCGRQGRPGRGVLHRGSARSAAGAGRHSGRPQRAGRGTRRTHGAFRSLRRVPPRPQRAFAAGCPDLLSLRLLVRVARSYSETGFTPAAACRGRGEFVRERAQRGDDPASRTRLVNSTVPA